jgi:hypothetical protein
MGARSSGNSGGLLLLQSRSIASMLRLAYGEAAFACADEPENSSAKQDEAGWFGSGRNGWSVGDLQCANAQIFTSCYGAYLVREDKTTGVVRACEDSEAGG